MLMSAVLPQGLTPHLNVIFKKIYIIGVVEQLWQHNSKGKEFLSINAT